MIQRKLDNMIEVLLKLLNCSQEDEKTIIYYLKHATIDEFFNNYKTLDLDKDTKEQIENIIIIIENYEKHV